MTKKSNNIFIVWHYFTHYINACLFMQMYVWLFYEGGLLQG